MPDNPGRPQSGSKPESVLMGPRLNPAFNRALDDLVAVARQGHRPTSEFFNPSKEWLAAHVRIFQDLPKSEQGRLLQEHRQVTEDARRENAGGRAARRAGPDAAFRLDSGGVAFFSQLGVARRPDLTQYFVDGFTQNRDAMAFSEASQALFADVIPHITRKLRDRFAAGDTVIQCDRGLGDVPSRSFHARQLLFGDHYVQAPYLWQQLTFPLAELEAARPPQILEISIPRWLDDLGLPGELKDRVKQAGLTQLVFKAPTKGLSLHLGFDYVGEHKMGPLSIAMFMAKEAGGLAVQAALSTARVKTLDGVLTNTALVTIGPSLHGKSTLTIMIELAGSQLAKLLHLTTDPLEGVYAMNDDIVLLQRFPRPLEVTVGEKRVSISHAIDGTENNFYAVPFGLTREDDPIQYDVIRGPKGSPNRDETLENVPVDPLTGVPDFLQNPTRNMRMVLSRRGLIARKGAKHLIEAMTAGQSDDSVHVPMEHMDRVFWQAVMRQNTVIPPLRSLTINQYVRVLMYGEAVQMGAAAGAIGRPYVEFFSDPFIIGLEDDNANLMHDILHEMARGGMPQQYYVFNTGGVGADSNEQASGPRYRKIPRELTLMLQEALLRNAVQFEYDPVLRSHVAVAVVDASGREVFDLRHDWLPRSIYGETEYVRRITELTRRRYYGLDHEDKAGILRYTKVKDDVFDLDDLPAPRSERELAWLLSYCWHVDQPCSTLAELVTHRGEGREPSTHILRRLQHMAQDGARQGLVITHEAGSALRSLHIRLAESQA